MSDTTDRQSVLEALASLQTGTREDNPTTFLLPPGVKRLLDPATVLVIGARGSGKSALARFLLGLHERLASSPADASLDLLHRHGVAPTAWIDAFSQHGTRHPDAITLDDLVRRSTDDELRGFWLAWFIVQVGEQIQPFSDGSSKDFFEGVLQRNKLARHDPASPFRTDPQTRSNLLSTLDGIHEGVAQAAQRRGVQTERFNFCAVYDDLDTVGTFDPTLRARFIRALLAMWTSFSTRYRHLRAKIFLPADMFDLRQFDTIDTSKLIARAERLEWDVHSLYLLVLRHLAQSGPPVRAWLESFGMRFRHLDDGLGWMPEAPSERSLRQWLAATLQEVIAIHGTRSHVEQWIANRLLDSKGRIAPRSMLGFFRESARLTLTRPPPAHGGLIADANAVAAIGVVGAQRVDEIRAVYEWVDRLLNLRGKVLPMPRAAIEALLEGDARDAPRETRARDGKTVTTEIVRLGLLRELRVDDLLDVPELFVEHFGVLRRENDTPLRS